jgi:hypothetical protein
MVHMWPISILNYLSYDISCSKKVFEFFLRYMKLHGLMFLITLIFIDFSSFISCYVGNHLIMFHNLL